MFSKANVFKETNSL